MRLLNVDCIVKRFYECFDKNNFPSIDSQLLINCIEELYQASFLKEEGKPIPFRIFLGNVADIEPNIAFQGVGYSKEHLRNEYTEFKDTIELNSDNIRKIGLSYDPSRFITIVNQEASKLYIKGFIYFSGIPLKGIADENKTESWEKSDLNFSGFVFESLFIGSLTISFKNIICNIQDGKLIWTDWDRKIQNQIYQNNPLNEELQKIFKSNLGTFLYVPLIDAIERIEREKCGGTLICTTDDELERIGTIIDIKYLTNIVLKDFDWKDTLIKNYWYNRISDFVYYFSRIDGAVIITNSSIKGHGAKINCVAKNSLPKELKNKGTRHRSAYALIENSKDNLFVFIVSADGGVTFIRNVNEKPEVSYFDGVEFRSTPGKEFDHLAFSDGVG